MLKQQLQQKLQQKLSPQQIQLIRLLELPAIELEERIKHELEDNPALEEGKEIADDFDRTDEGGEELAANESFCYHVLHSALHLPIYFSAQPACIASVPLHFTL